MATHIHDVDTVMTVAFHGDSQTLSAVCSSHIAGKDEMRGAQERREMHTKFWSENLKERRQALMGG
jgi:hypothetical protein